HILLLGRTVIYGLIFTQAALEAGHQLTFYVRRPSKIPTALSSNGKLTVIQGELGDAEGLNKAAGCGSDVFIISGLRFDGISLMRLLQHITDALKRIYRLLLASGTTKRIMILSTASYTAPEDIGCINWYTAVNFYIKVIRGDTYSEITGM
ncbi:hypothetical protein BJ875DRAFT_337332, partial [Amylocarpus encephaloides]